MTDTETSWEVEREVTQVMISKFLLVYPMLKKFSFQFKRVSLTGIRRQNIFSNLLIVVSCHADSFVFCTQVLRFLPDFLTNTKHVLGVLKFTTATSLFQKLFCCYIG